MLEDSVVDVYFILTQNPTYAKACGFKNALPSYRHLARFDQIMNHAGLWAKTKRIMVEHNLDYLQHSLRHIIQYRERSSVERMNSNLKDGFGFRRVHKRNRVNVEAHIDKCIAAVHMIAYMAHLIGKPELMRSWSRIMAA